jgi:FMN phosphatase YigB (HAD superfamily)
MDEARISRDFERIVEAPWKERSRYGYSLDPSLGDDYKSAIATYTFGSSSHDDSRFEAFISVLMAAKSKGIPVFILTNGSPIDVWATISALGLDEEDHIQAVYGCGSKFGYFNKYNCIKQIMRRLDLDCDGYSSWIFI